MKKLLLITFLFITFNISARQLIVPQNYNTIQMAIDSAISGDTVIVDNGLYFENITISAKDILLTSNYLFTSNFADIHNTIIDGSMPVNPDTASVVRIINGCGTGMIFQGFTLRAGLGTPFNLVANQIYIEGGGMAIQNSSPEIRFNYIYDNHCLINTGGIISSGAGGIHTFYDSAFIHNNIIEGNTGLYGNGVVLNNSKGIFSNNLVYNNRGGSQFGGGGVMVFCTVDSTSCRVLNNTIVSNLAVSGFGGFAGSAGGLFNIDCDNTILENNIIWGNYQKFGDEIANSNGQFFQTSYNTTGGTLSGINYNFNPGFRDSSFLAIQGSVSLDSGNPDSLHNDNEDQSNPGFALFPSQSTLRNDLGIYGGPYAAFLPIIEKPIYNQSRNQFSYTNPSSNDTITSSFIIRNLGSTPLRIDSLKFLNKDAIIHYDTIQGLMIKPLSSEVISLKWTPLNLINDTLIIYHNDTALGNISDIFFNVIINNLRNNSISEFIKITPNPIVDFATIKISVRGSFQLTIRDIYGRIIDVFTISEDKKIDIRNLNPGMYIFQIDGAKSECIKVVVQ